MKKNDLFCGILFTAAGILFLMLACRDTALQSLFCGLAGAGIGPGLMMIGKYAYWSRPEHRERYEEKLEEDRIEMRDERKEMLRGKTARYLYAFTLVVLGLSSVMFQIFEKVGMVEDSKIFIVYLGILFWAELLLSRWIFRRLEKKY